MPALCVIIRIIEAITETQPPAATLTASMVGSASPLKQHHSSRDHAAQQESDQDALYENVGTSARADRKGSLPPAQPTHASESTAKPSPKQRRESVPCLKAVSPTPQKKTHHNLHKNSARQLADTTTSTRSEREPGNIIISQFQTTLNLFVYTILE